MTTLYLTFTVIYSACTATSAYNTDTSSYDTLKSPQQNSFFGYSIATAEVDGKLTIFSGSPKFSPSNDSDTPGKAGAIYHCGLDTQQCTKLNFKPIDEDTDENNSTHGNGDEHSTLPEIALQTCPFLNTTCGYLPDDVDVWKTKDRYLTVRKKKLVNRFNKACYPANDLRTRLTGPPSYTVHEGIIVVDSDRAVTGKAIGEQSVVVLKSQYIVATLGITQCLRFCYNAYSYFDGKNKLQSKRSLRVFLRYENSEREEELFMFNGPDDIGSKYWNFTEINLVNTQNGKYKLFFEVTITKNQNSEKKCKTATVAADIALNDISVANAECGVEPDNTDVLDQEQAIGMSLKVNVSEDGSTSTMTACGPLWQKNCGYAKEAAGVCYEVTDNSTEIKALHNPASAGCIRGKIDVVLLVDQSGSVNQCNFQKVKRWLRNIVRGFTVGPTQQDIGIVLYSSIASTENVFELGFGKYNNDGKVKKRRMLEDLKKLEYAAGLTYTGVAFQHANELLWGPNARPDAKKMVILLTDGSTTKQDRDNLQKQVRITRQNNATILAVGVADFNESELVNISGSKLNFFPVKDFSQLELVRDKLRESVSFSALEGSHDNSSHSASMQNCQMGFSLHYGKDSLMMGSPGCYDRVGDVIRYSTGAVNMTSGQYNNSRPEEAMESLRENGTGVQHADGPSLAAVSTVTPVLTYETVADNVKPKPGFFEVPSLTELEKAMGGELQESYFGYAVTSGYFRGIAQGEFAAASAPRHGGTGVVLIYQSDSQRKITNPHSVAGMQLGEYFGASLCAEDVNSDGFTDLFIAAPLHSADNPDEGRVYVYMGRADLLFRPDAVLRGSGAPFSRFGTAVSTVSDLTLDGYKDIVVSSPNENSGRGAVYVFHGGKSGLHTSYFQRIAAAEFDKENKIKLFGQSAVGGIDVDKNGYPDMLIGAPGSDMIVILKTRPVVHIDSKFFITTQLIDRRDETCWKQSNPVGTNYDTACLACSVCFSYSGLSVPSGIGIHYDINADVRKMISRVAFYENKDSSRTIYGDIILMEADVMYCSNHTLYLKKNIGDMMTKVILRQNFDMKEYAHEQPLAGHFTDKERKSNALTPILDINTVKSLDASTMFKTYCEDTSSCVADISMEASGPVNDMGETVLNYVLNVDRIVRLKVDVVNSGPEDAHAVFVTVRYQGAMVYNSLKKTNCFKVLEEPEEIRGDVKTLSLGLRKTLLAVNEKCTGTLIFVASRYMKPHTHDHVVFVINGTTVSRDEWQQNNENLIKIRLRYSSEFTMSGSSYPIAISSPLNSNRSDETESSSAFQHIYSVGNYGLVGLRNITLTLSWPVCVEKNGYLLRVNYVDSSLCFDHGHHQYCEVVANNSFVLSGDDEICKDIYFGQDINETLHQNCNSKFVTLCPRVYFHAGNLPVQERLTLTVRGDISSKALTNLTSQLTITSELSLTMGYRELLIFPTSQEFFSSAVTTVDPPITGTTEPPTEKYADLPYWVYIASVGAGLVVVIMIVVLLKMLGFFKSKYADKKKEAQEDMLFSHERIPMNVET